MRGDSPMLRLVRTRPNLPVLACRRVILCDDFASSFPLARALIAGQSIGALAFSSNTTLTSPQGGPMKRREFLKVAGAGMAASALAAPAIAQSMPEVRWRL